MVKKLLFTCAVSIFYVAVQAQDYIETRLVYEGATPMKFTNEWQYLSSDVYLFHPGQFSRVLNEVAGANRIFKRKDQLQFLSITAKLKDLKFFGKDEMIYPLYNFKVNRDKDKQLKADVSTTKEVIRLLDNLPLSSVTDVVEADIAGKAITRNNKIKILQVVSEQMINISKLTNPTEATLYLVGELGKFMQSTLGNKQYEFSSTIRLYEGENFNQQLHSIKVYVFVPRGKQVTIHTRRLERFLAGKPGDVNRKVLADMLRYDDYPVMVVANYRSKYQMPVLVGEEISPEKIAARKIKVEQDYAGNLINDEIYTQEKRFIAFLDLFSIFKKDLESYTLASRMGNKLYISQSVFAVFNHYRELVRMRQERDKEFCGVSSYDNIFKQEYDAVMRDARLFMEKDHSLKSCRAMVHDFIDMAEERIEMDSLSREVLLNHIYSVELPPEDYMKAFAEGREILSVIAVLENAQLQTVYRSLMDSLKMMPPDSLAALQRDLLVRNANSSNCKLCRRKVMEDVKHFDARYEQKQQEFWFSVRDTLVLNGERALFGFLKMQLQFHDKISCDSVDDRPIVQKLQGKIEEYGLLVDSLNSMLTRNNRATGLVELEAYCVTVQGLLGELAQTGQLIVENLPLVAVGPEVPKMKKDDEKIDDSGIGCGDADSVESAVQTGE